jgi:hypothetical protein
MSGTNDASNTVNHEQHRALADDELGAVIGGFCESQYEPAAVELGDVEFELAAHPYGPRSR